MSDSNKKIHLIAIGGSVMHNLAIALKNKGYEVSGSDDDFFSPSKERLESKGLLPEQTGWFTDKIHTGLDAVILGMHAKKDNPELLKAQELGIPVYSFPEYVYEQSKNKQRIVIAGSHGKTSITSMILHVASKFKKRLDYVVGAQVEGFETMVKLTDDANVIIIEGDEYLSSATDLTPKFIRYQHHIALISGISWDHINVFPTFEKYLDQFKALGNATPKAGTLIYNANDKLAKEIVEKNESDILKFSYEIPKYEIVNGITYIIHDKKKYPLQIFGKHNLENLAAAQLICSRLSIRAEQFYEEIQSFKGAGKRLEKVLEKTDCVVFKDFAHSPSKLKATTEAVKQQYNKRSLVACMELHTFSSMNSTFLEEYKNTFDAADKAIVYFSKEVVKRKGLSDFDPEFLKKCFNRKDLIVISDRNELEQVLLAEKWSNKNLLMMSSGSFDQLDLPTLASKLNS